MCVYLSAVLSVVWMKLLDCACAFGVRLSLLVFS